MKNVDNNKNNNIDNSEDELDALINGESIEVNQESENYTKPTIKQNTQTTELPPKETKNPLASPALRLAAYIVESLYFTFFVLTPLVIFLVISSYNALSGESSDILSNFKIGYALLLILPLLYTIFQIKAFKEGTTLGHKFFKLYIISTETGELAKFGSIFLREVLAKSVLYSIPFLGTLYFFIDNFFIFSYEKKTLHDRFLKTSVIKVPGSNKRNIIVLTLLLGFFAVSFLVALLSPLLMNNVVNESNKEIAYQEAIAFTKEINALAAFTSALDAREQAFSAIESYYPGSSYVDGIFTSSNGISYQINFDGDTATLGEIYEGEIPLANSQLSTPEPTIDNNQLSYIDLGVDNACLLDDVSCLAYQEVLVFTKTINDYAAFTSKMDAMEQAYIAIGDMIYGSYTPGLFTSSVGISYEINFVGDTATIGKRVG
jgi:uncharacterized RDD family membrane protein YckC